MCVRARACVYLSVEVEWALIALTGKDKTKQNTNDVVKRA